MVDVFDMKGHRLSVPGSLPPSGGGGGPSDPYIESRVARLEGNLADVKTILARMEPVLGKMRDDMNEIKGKLSHMPTIWQIATVVLAMNAGIVAVSMFLVNLLKTAAH